jgi:large subunit ribosomal protein L17
VRHRKSGRKLGRSSSHRDALWNNLVTSLLEHGRIETTVPKAKELRRYADRTIWWGVSVHGLVAKGEKASDAERARVLHARRMAKQTVKTDNALARLFGDVGAHFAGRAAKGGYTRILKTRVRKGDAAPMALIELVGLGKTA